MERSHGLYNDSVQLVYEEQLLRNLVRMRYQEDPHSLNVSAIAAQYELAGQAEARPFFVAPNPSNSNIIFRKFTAILPDALVSGANRPTLTFTPANDSDAVRQFLTPIPSQTLLFLAQTGWPVSPTHCSNRARPRRPSASPRAPRGRCTPSWPTALRCRWST